MKHSEQIEARQLILDLYARLAGRDFDLPMLARAGEPFGITEAAFRTALTRLKQEGRVENKQRGRYRMIRGRTALQQRVLEWQQVVARRKSWSGAWVVALSEPDARSDRTVWRKSLRAFTLEGFRQHGPDLFTRPDNLIGGVTGVRLRLRELGVPKSVLVGCMTDLDETTVSQWIGAWRAREMESNLARITLQLQESMRKLTGRADGRAAAEALLLGRKAVRAILQDPLLPLELSSENNLERLIEAMAKYHEFGRAVWTSYLQQTNE